MDTSPQPPGDGTTTRIDCDTCVMEGTKACQDCIVTFLVGREPGDAVLVDVATERALRILGEGGLVPRLRHQGRRGHAMGSTGA